MIGRHTSSPYLFINLGVDHSWQCFILQCRFNCYALRCQNDFKHSGYLGIPKFICYWFTDIGQFLTTSFLCGGSIFQSFLEYELVMCIFKQMIVLRKSKRGFTNLSRYFPNNSFCKSWYTKWTQWYTGKKILTFPLGSDYIITIYTNT